MGLETKLLFLNDIISLILFNVYIYGLRISPNSRNPCLAEYLRWVLKLCVEYILKIFLYKNITQRIVYQFLLTKDHIKMYNIVKKLFNI